MVAGSFLRTQQLESSGLVSEGFWNQASWMQSKIYFLRELQYSQFPKRTSLLIYQFRSWNTHDWCSVWALKCFQSVVLAQYFSLVMNGQTQKTRGWLGAAGDECGILVADIPACLKHAVEQLLLCLQRNRGAASFLWWFHWARRAAHGKLKGDVTQTCLFDDV